MEIYEEKKKKEKKEKRETLRIVPSMVIAIEETRALFVGSDAGGRFVLADRDGRSKTMSLRNCRSVGGPRLVFGSSPN